MFKRILTTFCLALAFITFVGGVLALPDVAFAQVDIGLTDVGEASGLSDEDPRIVVGRLIRTAISFSGVILLLLIIYGGFVWMTAGGDSEKIEKAKRILTNAVIGMIIVAASYAIATFVINSVQDAIFGDSGTSSSGDGFSGGLGGGSFATFSVSSFSPEGAVPIRNVKPSITFSRSVDPETVAGSITVTDAVTGVEVVGIFDTVLNRVTFTPTAPCPEPNESRKCFDEDATYNVVVTTNLKSTRGTSLSCFAGCTSSFTTGDIIDTENPTVNIESPDSGARVEPNSLTMIQISATDDVAIAGSDFALDDVVFDSVAASGEDLTSVLIETNWDSSGFDSIQLYTLKATVTDIAGNFTVDTISVRVNPSHCANRRQDVDEGELGIDCGGDCGACASNACETNNECSSGMCIDGVCTDNPVVLNVSPLDGAPGTLVTIAGEDFGTRAGTVNFVSEDGGVIAASIPECSDGWTDTEVVVEVPLGAADGPITIVTSSDLSDTSENEIGPMVPDFDVNTIIRPSICKISPTLGRTGDSATVIGRNFGGTQGDSKVRFQSDEVLLYNSWNDGTINIEIPSLPSQEYNVAVSVGGVLSNAVQYKIREESTTSTAGTSGTGDAGTTDGTGGTGDTGSTGDTGDTDGTEDTDGIGDIDGSGLADTSIPSIGFVNPENGGIGQYLTLAGSNFGERTGAVWFVNQTSGYTAIGSIDFPVECSNDYWGSDEITIIIPEKYSNDEPFEITTHDILITRNDGVQSSPFEYQVTTEDPTPGICFVSPNRGENGSEITIYGSSLGSGEGSVTFYNEVGVTDIRSWSGSEVTVIVPDEATTGPLSLASTAGESSNRMNFEVGSGLGAAEEGDVPDTVSAAYAWSFSTGTFPKAPALIVVCDAVQVSAVPSTRFTTDTCVNANVYGEFTMVMDQSTLVEGDTILIEECSDTSCSETEPVRGQIIISSGATSTNFRWAPGVDYNEGILKTDTRYQVTVTNGVASSDGVFANDNVVWVFDVGSSDENCSVSEVRVSPSTEILNVEGETTEFSAIPGTQDCQVLNPEMFSWTWDIDSGIASIEEGTCVGILSDTCAVVTAFVEGVTDVTATEIESSISGAGRLTIEFTDPYISNNWPACTEACTNSSIGANFNISMDQTSVEAESAVVLKECQNELCLSFNGTVATSASCVGESGECTGFTFGALPALQMGAFYRVIVAPSVLSKSGVALTRPNYGEQFSWTFRTKQENAECVISRLELNPASVTLGAIRETQVFSLEAYGDPDSCSVAGQKVNTYNYNWIWEDPIIEDANVASWVKINGGFIDVDLDSIPAGCSASCLALGSEPRGSVCGNGQVEVGEDCDDENVSDGDGCSSSCLFEGTGEFAICGDGDISYGEECEDGNTENGDGCSSVCLREGSGSVGATCGNGDLAQDLNTFAGEDCDDGNRRSGDGCSSICLNEGTVSLTAEPAVCGDGVITRPYERCDDGNAENGDGCSSRCLREGQLPGSVCGDNKVNHNISTGAGEDCDREEGCSEDCLWLGSSLSYETPSVCGDGLDADGLMGTGELFVCESGSAGNNRIDPIQIAKIDESATLQVDVVTQLATATIRVSSEKFGVAGKATLNLSCAAKVDADCSEGFGPANNSCCSARPTGSVFPTSTEACRNAMIYGVFNQRMDLDSFSDNFYIKVDTDTTGGVCPDGYTTFTGGAAKADGPWFARVWQKIKSIFSQKANAQVVNDCILSITNVSQRELAVDAYEIIFRYETLLAPNATHTIVATADTLGDVDENGFAIKDGILSNSGVQMANSLEQSFTTISEVCSLNRVDIIDTDVENPEVFRLPGETHTLVAAAYSNRGGRIERIEEIPGVYEWDWLDWREDSGGSILAVTSMNEDKSSADLTAQAGTGEAHAVAQVQIIDAGDAGPIVSGDIELEAIICQSPWPTFDSFPFLDEQMHFSSFYCRDSGEDGSVDDYPALTSVEPPVAGSASILKEYLLKVNDGSGDAIGIRVISNEDYLSPTDWYFASGFAGSPTVTEVDGFEAIKEGRTTYIAAPNVADSGTIYPNIYVVSYNEGASSTTIEIFNQFMDNFELATNLSVALCHDGLQYTSTQCSADWDCNLDAGETCGSNKMKVQRDMKRLTDIKNISNSIDAYGLENGKCSSTQAQSCSSSIDCPGGESCVPSVPTLFSGTFLRGRVSSSWSSWGDQLGSSVGSIPTDPLNGYGWTCGSYCENSKDSCSADSDCQVGEACLDSANPGFDRDTCVNQTNGQYICTEGSYAYHYRSVGEFEYELSADLEYTDANWAYDYDKDAIDNKTLTIGGNSSSFPGGFTSTPYCSNTLFGNSDECGDGVVSATELCELGQRGEGSEAVCIVDGATVAGSIDRICNNTCTAFIEDPAAVCVPIACGNGVIEGSEVCDDGSSNGKYGFCDNNCSYAGSFTCGDGSLAGGEACDCGIDSASGRAFGSGLCSVSNGQYSSDPGDTCSWDCRGPANYCGDGIVDVGEQCDGNTEEYSGKLCLGWLKFGQACETEDDCEATLTEYDEYEGEVISTTSTSACGDPNAEWANECLTSNVCIDGDTVKVGYSCNTDLDCGEGGLCSTTPIQTTRSRGCADDGANGSDVCSWDVGNWSSSDCKAVTSCGNGVEEAGEECDDGNRDTNDECTNVCTINVCGDGALNLGVEDCDEGSNNGQICSSAYGSTCSYCSNDCRQVTTSGTWCGDGAINGDELCDGGDLPYYFFNENLREINGSCTSDQIGVENTRGDIDYICSNVGACNGNSVDRQSKNGQFCTSSSSCGSGSECIFPTCSNDCRTSCPITFESRTLNIEADSIDTLPSRTISLFSTSNPAVGQNTGATIIIPECSVSTGITADIKYNFEQQPDQAYVLYLLDTSGSMTEEFSGSFLNGTFVPGDTHLEIAQESIVQGMFSLFDVSGDVIRVGFMTVHQPAFFDPVSCLTDFCPPTPIIISSDPIVCDGEIFCGEEGKQNLRNRIETTFVNQLNGKTMAAGLVEARNIFSALPSDSTKILVVYQDFWDYSSSPSDFEVYNLLKGDGVQIYTAAINAGLSNEDYWFRNTFAIVYSSGNPNQLNGIDYGHPSNLSGINTGRRFVSEYIGIASEIIRSVGVLLKVTWGERSISQFIQEGNGVQLSLPEAFICMPGEASSVNVEASYLGDGSIDFSNFGFNMCSP